MKVPFKGIILVYLVFLFSVVLGFVNVLYTSSEAFPVTVQF